MEADVKIQVLEVSHYLAPPLPDNAIDGLPSDPSYTRAPKVPVIRIFGSTPAGQKSLIHIHGVFPYFFIRCEDPLFDDPDKLRKLLPSISLSVESAIAINQSSDIRTSRISHQKKPRHQNTIAKIMIVKGNSFYGYSIKEHLFLKVVLYCPSKIRPVVRLFESGIILQRKFQSYESHIPYYLQMFVDYKVDGMDFIYLRNIKFRLPLPESQSHLVGTHESFQPLDTISRKQYVNHVFTASSTPTHLLHDTFNLKKSFNGRFCSPRELSKLTRLSKYEDWKQRQSCCALELDVACSNILNPFYQEQKQKELKENRWIIPTLRDLWIQEYERPTHALNSEKEIERNHKTGLHLSQSYVGRQMQESLEKLLENITPSSYSKEAINTKNEKNDIYIHLMSAQDSASTLEFYSGKEMSYSSSLSLSEDVSVASGETRSSKEKQNAEDEEVINLLIAMKETKSKQWSQNVHGVLRVEQELDHIIVDVNEIQDETEQEVIDVEDSNQIELSQIENEFDWELEKKEFEVASQEVEKLQIFNTQMNLKSQEDIPVSSINIEDINIASRKQLNLASCGLSNTETLNFKAPGDLPQTEGIDDVDDRSISNDKYLQPEVGIEDSCVIEEDILPPQPPLRHPLKKCKLKRQREPSTLSTHSSILIPSDSGFHMGKQQCLTLEKAFQEETPEFSEYPIQSNEESKTHEETWNIYKEDPPSKELLLDTLEEYNVLSIENPRAYVETITEISGSKRMNYGGVSYPLQLELNAVLGLKTFEPMYEKVVNSQSQVNVHPCIPSRNELIESVWKRGSKVWEPIKIPPPPKEIRIWLAKEKHISLREKLSPSRVTPSCLPIDLISTSSAYQMNKKEYNLQKGYSNFTLLSMELHINTRGNFLPDPFHDPITSVIYMLQIEESERNISRRGIIALSTTSNKKYYHEGLSTHVLFEYVNSELELFRSVVQLFHQWDPDFCVGYDTQKDSFGYFLERAAILKIPITRLISRIPWFEQDFKHCSERTDIFFESLKSVEGVTGKPKDNWNERKASGIFIHGRIVLNLWRIMRSELKLSKYALEDVVMHVFKKRIPVYACDTLTRWYLSNGSIRWRVFEYYLRRSGLNLSLVNHLDLITRTSEMSRLFGMDFFSVLSRGSQFRVENVLLRITKPRNYVLISPNRDQVACQAAMECIPLVMEPRSQFYHDPVVVLDFQSLYPSIMIAYNICYSTCLGRLSYGSQAKLENQLGVVQDFRPLYKQIKRHGHDCFMSPNGVLFLPSSTQRGILPLMMEEILKTRIMIKQVMKMARKNRDSVLERVSNARQLALKLIANVTYGYTAAGYSGRMPCAQIADAIVQYGRCTLERSIEFIESHSDWKANVVYGDTDSVFVLLKGRTKQEAFQIGREIAHEITKRNPSPIQLKLEKVYLGCILVSKKRYVGYKFEHEHQSHGIFDAKGIEIARRDTCPLVARIMEKSLRLLFTTRNISLIKKYLCQQWTKLLKDTNSGDSLTQLSDFIFSKEVRLGTYSLHGILPPAAIVSTKAMTKDRRAEPRYAERIPYVVINGPPGSRLVDLVISPVEFSKTLNIYTLNIQYYITKQIIPALERVFSLIGVNIREWYTSIPRFSHKVQRFRVLKSFSSTESNAPTKIDLSRTTRHATIDVFFATRYCYLCQKLDKKTLCIDCVKDIQRSTYRIQQLMLQCEEKHYQLLTTCRICCQLRDQSIACINVQCKLFEERLQYERKIRELSTILAEIQLEYDNNNVE